MFVPLFSRECEPFHDTKFVIGVVHILRNQLRGGGGVSE